MQLRLLCAVMLGCALGEPVLAQAPVKPEAAPVQQELLENGDFSKGVAGWGLDHQGTAKYSLVDAEAGPFKKAARLELNPKQGDPIWSIGVYKAIPQALSQGDALVLKLWARAEQPARVHTFLQQAAKPFTKSFGRTFALDQEWREYTVRGGVTQAFKADEANVAFYLGEAPAVIELTGLRLLREPNAGAPEPEAGPAVATRAADAANLLRNGDFVDGTKEWEFAVDTARSITSILSLNDSAYTHALRFFAIPGPKDEPWSLWAQQKLANEWKTGDSVALQCYIRSFDGVPVTVQIVDEEQPENPLLTQFVERTGDDWQRIALQGTLARDYKAGQLQVMFLLAHVTGAVDITGVELSRKAAP